MPVSNLIVGPPPPLTVTADGSALIAEIEGYLASLPRRPAPPSRTSARWAAPSSPGTPTSRCPAAPCSTASPTAHRSRSPCRWPATSS